jgi:hypothetical protein
VSGKEETIQAQARMQAKRTAELSSNSSSDDESSSDEKNQQPQPPSLSPLRKGSAFSVFGKEEAFRA